MTLPTDPLVVPAVPAPAVPLDVPAHPLDVPTGPVGEEAVQVEAAESELRRLGLDEIRVRHHGDMARLEAPHHDLASMTAEPLRGEVLRAVRSAGFRSVALDLEAVAEAAPESPGGNQVPPGPGGGRGNKWQLVVDPPRAS